MSAIFIFKEQNSELFWKYLEEFVTSNSIHPAYLKLNLEWQLSISQSKGLLVEDKSFVYVVDNKPKAYVFLPIEKKEGLLAGTLSGGFIYAPIFSDYSFTKEVFNAIDEIAVEMKLEKIMFSIDPLSLEKNSFNFLQRFNYLDASILTYIIDCGSPELLLEMRRGHKSDVKKIQQNEDFKVLRFDSTNCSFRIHEEFRQLSYKCAGREIRPQETYDKQFEILKNNQAVLFCLVYKGQKIAFAHFEYNKDKAFYTVGVDDPDFEKMPLYHTLIYTATKFFKDVGVRYIDTGQPSSPSTQFLYYPDAKQLNIALFKRGFGGDFKQNFRGLKYYSGDSFLADTEVFIKNYKLKI